MKTHEIPSENLALWKLYLVGRKHEYKLLGFIWAPRDRLPRCLRDHPNMCFDIVNEPVDNHDDYFQKPWPKGDWEKFTGSEKI